MNAFLKAALKEAYDLEQIGVSAFTKRELAALVPLLIQVGQDIPALITNWPTAEAELVALVSNPAADADLVAYGIALGWTTDVKVQAVIGDVAGMLLAIAQGVAKLASDLKV